MTTPSTKPLLLPMLIAISLSGCASKEFVQQEVGGVGKRLDALQAMLDKANQRIEINTRWLNETDGRVGKAETAQAALANRLDETASGLAGAGKKIDTVAAELATARQQVDANTTALAQANQRLDGNTAALAQASQRIDANAAALTQASQRVDALDGRVTAAATLAENTRQDLAGNTDRVARLEGEVATARAPALATPAAVALPPATADAEGVRADTGAAEVVTPNTPAPAQPTVVTTAQPAGTPTAGVAAATEAAALTDNRARLDAISARIEAASKQIDANTAAILAASERLKAVEGNLSAGQQSGQAGTAALAATEQHVGEVKANVDAVGERIAGNDAALADATKRLDDLEAALAVTINKVDNADRQTAEQDDRIKALDARVSRNEQDIGQATASAREALERAIAAGKLAQGKVVYETQLTDDTSPFKFDSAELTEATKQLLTALADKLKAANENVYLEIQGHTDNSGPAEANQRLALARAEAVRDYLHDGCGLPLHRMSVISYGERKPLADNKTRAGRAKNRRVQIVVLK